ncbi:MAG: hypothetical protein NZ740_08985 [Kiritimatiellae bacterium]|nr:hypothetical protein [Kiritimatiellia bacterium]MDW8459227.1 hypothetical protein [Verrucomicrobiota bacterium]
MASLVDREDLTAMDLARGSMDAARLIAVGPAALDEMGSRFRGAATFGEAATSGLYLAAWGGSAHLALIKRELESNPTKRGWLHRLVGTEEAFLAHLDSGGRYQPLLQLMPDVGGVRALTHLLMRSKDPLVRRAGLFWGYWLADRAYWNAVRALAKTERDRTTLRLVQEILKRASE